MGNRITNSDLYISIGGDAGLFNDKSRKNINRVFKVMFSESSKKVSDTSVENHTEIIFRIKSPIMAEENLMKDFFERLEALLEALHDYNPHFTQFKGVNNQ